MILNDKILKRIYKQERGWVFCSKDFLDYGSRNNIDKMLSILAFNKEILRIERGIYYYPKLDDKGTPLPPSMIMIAKAVANNFGLKIFPSGQKALKMLGFPISEVEEGLFWTNGKTIKKKVGQIQLDFKHKKIIPFSKTPEAVITVLCAIMQTGKKI